VLKNSGTGPVTAIVLTDDKLGIIPGPVSGDDNANAQLDSGESWTYTADAVITETTTNLAKAEGRTPDGEIVVVTSNRVQVSIEGIPAPEFPSPAFPVLMVIAIVFLAMEYRRR